ncbi:MAG: hypothetical protein HC859_12545 [Bacteroidia bacterium]|nr:hypothetical protein [Bacteroidia bacterium]
MIEPTKENGAKVIVALQDAQLEVPEIRPEEFESRLVLSFGFEPDAVDIINFTAGIDFAAAYSNAIPAHFSGIPVKILDIHDLIRNKESLNRKEEKSLLDQYDAAVLKKILKKDKGQSD